MKNSIKLLLMLGFITKIISACNSVAGGYIKEDGKIYWMGGLGHWLEVKDVHFGSFKTWVYSIAKTEPALSSTLELFSQNVTTTYLFLQALSDPCLVGAEVFQKSPDFSELFNGATPRRYGGTAYRRDSKRNVAPPRLHAWQAGILTQIQTKKPRFLWAFQRSGRG